MIRFNWFSLLCNSFITAHGRDWQRISVRLGRITPTRATLHERSSIIIRCGSSSQVNWTYATFMDHYAESLSNKHDNNNESLGLLDLLYNDSGFYYCEGLKGRRPFLSWFTLNVWQITPFGLVVPNWIEVSKGDSVTLSCGSFNEVLWFSIHYYEQNKTVGHRTLTLHNLQEKHSGPYTCRGTFFNRKLFHYSSRIIVDGSIDIVYNRRPFIT